MFEKKIIKSVEKLNIEISIPRITKRQTQICNISSNNPKDYYRVSVFVPQFDNFITALEEITTNHLSTLLSFDSLYQENDNIEDFRQISSKYIVDLENTETQNLIIEFLAKKTAKYK